MNDILTIKLFLIFLCAGLIKGVSGMGLPTFSMALLTLIMPIGQAASLMIFPSLITNFVQCFGKHFFSLCKHLWPFWLTLLLGAVYSPLPDVFSSTSYAKVFLGITLTVYGAWSLNHSQLPDMRAFRLKLGIICGTLSGFFTASTGIFVIPLVPFLQSLHYSKNELVQALGISFSVATVGLMFRIEGQVPSIESILNIQNLISITGAFFGLIAGSIVRKCVNQILFKKILNIIFISLGVLISTKEIFSFIDK